MRIRNRRQHGRRDWLVLTLLLGSCAPKAAVDLARFDQRIQRGAIDTFNLFNSKNLKQPQDGNLLFNFDGTLQAGLGDPRQAQLGVKLLF